MVALDTVALGIILLSIGVALTLGVYLALRALPRLKPRSDVQADEPPLPARVPANQDAFFIIQAGGRVIYTNPRARQWFAIPENQQPNLEHLASQARPREVFLNLCASEGQARFTLAGLFVEAASYRVPYDDQHAVVLTLRRPQLTALTDEDQAPAGKAIDIISELSQAMTASLDLETTLKAVLENVDRLIPSDFSEITLWDSAHQQLIPYRFTGLAGVERQLETTTERYRADDGYSGYLLSTREPLLVEDVDTFRLARPVIDRQRYPIRAYLGIPLLIAGDPVGTLELASLNPNAFNQNDLEVLRILARQAAVAIQNARVHEQEQRRAAELAGLANLAQATAALRDPKDLFAHLVDSIGPLLDVEILGFLIYNEETGLLQGMAPFQGMPDQVVELYRTAIPLQSEAEKILLRMETILATDPAEDPRINTLGLAALVQAAGIHSMALMPLSSSGRPLGYLQVANKRDGTPLDQDDLRLLAIIAGQVGPILDNASLIQQSRRRAREAEALRRITSLAASGATVDEILKFSLLELARLLGATVAGIFLLDSDQGELRLHLPSLFGVAPEAVAHIQRLDVNQPDYRLTVTGALRPFVSDDIAADERILELYRPLISAFGDIHSVIDVPLEMRESGIGEVILGNPQIAFFGTHEAQLAFTAARQLASAIERSSLYTQTDEALRQRLDQLALQTRVARELSTSLELPPLLAFIHQETLHLSQAQRGSVWAIDPSQPPEQPACIIHCAGEPPGESLPGVATQALDSGTTALVEDYQKHDFAAPWPEIRSSLACPLNHRGQVVGLILLHAREAGHFTPAIQESVEAIAAHAAAAIHNAQRYQEELARNQTLNQQVAALDRLLQISQTLKEGLPLEQKLEALAGGMTGATEYQAVVISVYEAESGELRLGACAGLEPEAQEALATAHLPWQAVADLLKLEFRVGEAYLIPQNSQPEALEGNPLIHPTGGQTLTGERHSQDALVLPLTGSQEQPLGLITLSAPPSLDHPIALEVEAAALFAHQIAFSIESHRHLRALTRQVEELQEEARRARQAHQTASAQLPRFLHKDLEQTLAIHHLNQRARRLRAGLDIAEIVNLQPDRSAVLWALGQEMLTRMNLDVALVADASPGGPRLLHTLGPIPPEANPEALLGQRNPLRQCLQSGETILVANLSQDPTWQNAPLLQALEAAGFVCLPIATNGKAEAAVIAISHEPLPPFTQEDEQIYGLLAGQVAITLQNLSLLTETRRRLREVGLLLEFSRQLGSLDPVEILRTLVDSTLRVVSSAHAGVVALWDERQKLLVPKAAAGYTDNQRITEICYQAGEALPGQVFARGEPLQVDELDFAGQYRLSPENLLLYREATGGRLPVSSLLVPLQAGDAILGVLTLDNFNTPAAFSSEDQALVTSLADQTALALENARLYQDSENRAAQLRSLTAVAATITSSLQSDELIASLLDHISAILPYDTATLWLRKGNELTVRAARGFEESEERVGLTVAVEDSQLLNEMVASGQPINVDNVHADARFPALVDHMHLSWLGIPLIAKGEVVGVIALEKTEPGFYTHEHVQVATTLAGQVAVALENARLFEESVRRTLELDQRTQRLDLLNRIASQLSQSLDPEQIMQFTADQLRQALRASLVSAIRFEPPDRYTLVAEVPLHASQVPQHLPATPLFEYLQQSLGVFSTDDAGQVDDLAPLHDFFAARHTHGLLVLPLATGSDLHGLLLAHTDRTERFPASEIELARTISNQAAVALQNALLFEQTRRLTEDLEQLVAERTKALQREHQRTQTLLNIITELSGSLDLDIIINRTLALINDIAGAEQSTVLLVRPEESTLLYRASQGFTTPPAEGGQISWLKADEGLAGWVISEQQSVLIHDLRDDPRWVQKEGELSEHRSAIAVPLLVGAEALGTLMLFHRQPGRFSPDMLDLIQATAKQIAVAINNAQLYLLIRDQAERLGAMLRAQQVEATRSRAILESIAEGVLVTDANDVITLFNAAAAEILNLPQEQVLDKSLDAFTGLFGRAGSAWRDTIHRWSVDPSTYAPGDAYNEEIELEDGRVVAVSLAPVILRDELIGTVSIFRDITHRVEVDRLKSEFVATVSHELRTPMTSIKGYVDVMLLGAAGELNPQQKEFMEVVKSNTERLNALVDDLLDVSRIEAGKIQPALQPLDLRLLAEEVVAAMLRRARQEAKSILIEVEPSPRVPRVMGDSDLVSQILTNLVENAYLYTPEGGSIRVSMHRAGDEVQVDVRDTGIGIAPQDQARVFERFYRGEDPLVLASAGTGLGLSIVRQLVEMHNGRIWVESSGVPGEGSTFSFTLPVYQTAGEE